MAEGPESIEPSQLGFNEGGPGPQFATPSGEARYKKLPYAPPEVGALYSVRDKGRGERIIRVTGKSDDGTRIDVETLEERMAPALAQLNIEALERQAARGWCSLLVPVSETDETVAPSPDVVATIRLDIQNFSRCCADINRANIRFDTQLIKDVGDGPFRAGDYEQAFRTFEQITIGFTAAVSSSRRAIADGRRRLTAEKGKLSGKEIQERTAAFSRGERLVQTAEREFSAILEGLRMHLRAQQTPTIREAPDASTF